MRAIPRFATSGLLLAVSLCGAVWALERGRARRAQEREDAAQAAAESWLKLVDAAKYADSWEEAATLFKGAATLDQWKQAVRGVRDPLGELVSREIQSRTFTEQLPGAPDGEYVVLQYDTVFENKASALETVTPMRDADGRWRVSGYFVK